MLCDLPQTLTIRQATECVLHVLENAGDTNPQVSARWILEGACGLDRTYISLHEQELLSPEAITAIDEALYRRCTGEPLQYIFGASPFRYAELECQPGVFIPRPETEVLVDKTLAAIDQLCAEHGEGWQPHVVDLCCGSGSVAVSLASERSQLCVQAVDINPQACALTKRNALKLGVQQRVEVFEGSLFEPIEAGKYFDIVVSNPPYIPTANIAQMPSEVTQWEPMNALDGGRDGLDVFRQIVAQCAQRLAPGGYLLCELDESTLQSASLVCCSMQGIEFDEISVVRDLAGRERILVARRLAACEAKHKTSDNIMKVDLQHPNVSAIFAAAAYLSQGQAVVFPTDTVYGIGVGVLSDSDPSLLFEIKQRDISKAIPWLVGSVSDLQRYGRNISEYCLELANKYWPGPLTLIVEASEAVPAAFLGDGNTIALRMPDSPVALAIIQAFGNPVATTSANMSGEPAVNDGALLSSHVVMSAAFALDGGVIVGGKPSTIVSCLGAQPVVVREGSIVL